MARRRSLEGGLSQADQIFLAYGQAMFRAQCVEQDVESFVEAMTSRRAETGKSTSRDKLSDQTLGALWKRVDADCDEVDKVWSETVRVFVRSRNYMAHDFLVDAIGATANGHDAAQALTFLRNFERACAVTAHHLGLLREALALHGGDRFHPNLEQTLARSNDIDHSTVISFRRFIPDA